MNPYDILNVDRSANIDEIKTAYKKAARFHHPDLGGCSVKMAEVNQAYEELIKQHQQFKEDKSSQPEPTKQTKPTQRTDRQWKDFYWKLALQEIDMKPIQRREWITWNLEAMKPPLLVWEIHAETSGYNPAWAYLKYKLSTKNS